MRADNSIHLTDAARQRAGTTRAKAIAALHELDRAGAVSPSTPSPATPACPDHGSTPSPTSRTRSAGCATAPTPTRARRPRPQRASDDSLRQRLEIANRRIRELADENQRLRRQLAHALGELRDNGRPDPPSDAADHRNSVTIGPC